MCVNQFGFTEEWIVADQPVIAPDQQKPGYGKPARVGAVISVVILLLMLAGNHHGKVEDLWLVGSAAALVFLLVADRIMRKNGIKR
jgi:hypothetical protein